MLDVLAGAAIAAGLAFAVERLRARRWLRRASAKGHAAYWAEYDAQASEAELGHHVDLLTARLGRGWFQAPEVPEEPEGPADPVAYLRAMVRLAGQQFALDLPEVEVYFTPNLPGHHAAEVYYPSQWTLTLEGERAIVRSNAPSPAEWRIAVREEYRDDRPAIAAIAGHEVAHVVLIGLSLGGADQAETERLTDAAAVLAGFGPALHRVAFREKARLERGRRHWSASHLSYLHQRAIAWLRERRRSISATAAAAAT